MNFTIMFFLIFISSADAKSISKRFAATAVSKELAQSEFGQTDIHYMDFI